MRRLVFVLLVFIAFQSGSAQAESAGNGVSGAAVIQEMNLARTNPASYANYVAELRARFHGNILVLPGRTMLRTQEGTRALDEAIRFLRNVQPLAPLTLSSGMCRAASEHCSDQANGRMGHGGSDSSSPADRMNRYGRWGAIWGENISYGKSSARDIVLALIIDDGLRGRKHRKNIFNPAFTVTGAASGAHARYRSVCSIEFAGSFAERGERVETLVAGNP